MKRLLQLKAPKWTIIVITIGPAILTAAIWVIIYLWLREAVREHQSIVTDFGPGAVLVAWHRRRIVATAKKTKDIIARK